MKTTDKLIAIKSPTQHLETIEQFISGLKGAKVVGIMLGTKIVFKPIKDDRDGASSCGTQKATR